MGMFMLSRFSCVSLERSCTDLLLQSGPPGRNSGVGDRMDKKLQKAKSGGRCRHFGVSVELQWGCLQSGLELQLSWKSKATYLSPKLSLMVQSQLKLMCDLLRILQFRSV